MIIATTEKVKVVRKYKGTTTGKDGKDYEYFKVYIADGIYPVKYPSTKEVYAQVEENEEYTFDVKISKYQGVVEVRLVQVYL